VNQKKRSRNFSSLAMTALVAVLIVISAAASTLMRPWVNFVQESQKVLLECDRIQSIACTKQLQSAQKQLAKFARNSQALGAIPVFNQVAPILSAHVNLLESATEMQACLVDCQNTDLNELAGKTQSSLERTHASLTQSSLWQFLAAKSTTLSAYERALYSMSDLSQSFTPLLPHTAMLLGAQKPITYRILLQNNKEIRPSGGFMGSFATLTLNNARIQELKVEDIYVPDGQIKGYVAEPFGVKNYLFDGQHPGWRLRDSNWHPDFPTAAQSINWFFAEGQEKPADVLVALNLSTVEAMLSHIGPIAVMDYGVSVDAKSIYAITQAQAEHNFFPGSTQKGDFLRSLAKSFMQQLAAMPLEQQVQLLTLMQENLVKGEIMLVAQDSELNQALEHAQFTGKLPDITCQENGCEPLVLGIVESNVGATKANCCIERDFSNQISVTDSTMTQVVSLQFTNSSLANPEPPYHFGGGYKNYMRILLPKDALVSSIAIDGQALPSHAIDQETFSNYIFWGFLHTVEGGQTSRADITIQKPLREAERNQKLLLIKQPGIPETQWQFASEIDGTSSKKTVLHTQTMEIAID
jgi:hypothetical protein